MPNSQRVSRPLCFFTHNVSKLAYMGNFNLEVLPINNQGKEDVRGRNPRL